MSSLSRDWSLRARTWMTVERVRITKSITKAGLSLQRTPRRKTVALSHVLTKLHILHSETHPRALLDHSLIYPRQVSALASTSECSAKNSDSTPTSVPFTNVPYLFWKAHAQDETHKTVTGWKLLEARIWMGGRIGAASVC